MIAEGMYHIDVERIDRLDRLAPYVSILPWFNVTILHKFYLNIFEKYSSNAEDKVYKNRSISCADLLNSPFVSRLNHNIYSIQPVLQDRYRLEMAEHPEVVKEIGAFMLASTIECKEHFFSTIYLENFRIEANLILNPQREAARISQHIVNRLNQSPNIGTKKQSVAYHLNILRQNNPTEEQKELIKFMEGLQDYNENDSEIPSEWKELKDLKNKEGTTITVKLPATVKNAILDELEQQSERAAQGKLFSLFVGINEYQSTEISSLYGSVNDARNFQSLVTTEQLPGNSNFQQILLNEDATLEAIVRSIEETSKEAKDGDTFFFFFAGYGAVEVDKNGASAQNISSFSTGTSSKTKCLIPYDYSQNSTYINQDELFFLLSKFPTGCKCVIVLDCGFERFPEKAATKMPPVFRSLADPLDGRNFGEFLYNNEKGIRPNPSFSGILILPSSENENVQESRENGLFSNNVLTKLSENENRSSYRDLAQPSENDLMFGDRARPSFKTYGNFDSNQLFLHGHLKTEESPSAKLIRICRETQADVLNLSNQKLSSFPREIFELEQIVSLDLSDNELLELPEEIGLLKNLEELILSRTSILLLPQAIASLENLKVIYLDEIGTYVFPSILLKNQSLERISLQGNHIKFVPPRLASLNNIQEVNLQKNEILNLPAEMKVFGKVDLDNYLAKAVPKNESSKRKILAIGMDYESKLPNISRELEMIQNTFTNSDLIEVVTLENPTISEIFYKIYQLQNQLIVLHFAAHNLSQVNHEFSGIHAMEVEDWVEMISSIRTGFFNDCLLFLNCNKGEEYGAQLLKSSFDHCISVPNELDDQLAYEFASHMYEGLELGKPLKSVMEAFSNRNEY